MAWALAIAFLAVVAVSFVFAIDDANDGEAVAVAAGATEESPLLDASGNVIPTDSTGRIAPGTLPLPGTPTYAGHPEDGQEYADYLAVYLDSGSIGFVESAAFVPPVDGEEPMTDRVELTAVDLDGEPVGTYVVNDDN
jgi:hypothetical protein